MGKFLPDKVFDSFSSGVNLRDAPLIPSGDLIQSENIVPIAGGRIEGRGGQTELTPTAIDGNPVRSLYRFYKQNGTKITLATSGTKVYKIADDGTITEIDSGYTANQKFSFVTWSSKDKVYWTNGIETIKSYDGTTVATLGGSPPVCRMIELHDDRLWALQANLVSFTDLNVDNVWPAANALNLADKYGGFGQFIKSFGRGLLIVGKDTGGLYRFEGSPKLGGQLTHYSDYSCVARWSACITPFGVIFLAQNGVIVTDGLNADTISGKLDPLFTAPFSTAVGGYYPKKRQYFLSFSPSLGQNDQLWVATYVQGPEPFVSWNKYTGFSADSFSVWDGGDDLGEFHYGLSTIGKIRRLDIGQQDVGVDYRCMFQTHWEAFGTMTRAKQIRWLYPIFEGVEPTFYQIGYTFGFPVVSGQLGQTPQTGIVWGPGAPVWGPGAPIWLRAGAINSEVTSTLNFNWGRFVSFTFENTGDGSGWKFDSLTAQSKVKDHLLREPFAIAG